MAFADQLDFVILHPHIFKRPKDAVDLTVSSDRSLFVHQGGDEVERPAVLVRRLYPG